MIDQDFNRAREKAVLIGAAYDFKTLARGLSANINIGWGWDAINPTTRPEGAGPDGVRRQRRLSPALPRARPS